MATVTASQYVSGSTRVSTAISESKSSLAQLDLKNQFMTRNGLRSLNNVNMSQIKCNAKALTKRTERNGCQTENDHPLSAIACGSWVGFIFVAAEVAPWSKTGGLGDVLGGLPPAMAARGYRAMTICPRYDQYKDGWDTNVLVEIQVGDRIETVRFFHCYKRGVDRVFVDHPIFLQKVWGKTGSKIYGPRAGKDYDDNQLRFQLLCLVTFVQDAQLYNAMYLFLIHSSVVRGAVANAFCNVAGFTLVLSLYTFYAYL